MSPSSSSDGGPDRGPAFLAPDGVRVLVLVTPKSGADAVRGLQADADGTLRWKVTVTAAPEDGKANAALLKLLAKRWGVPKSTLDVVAGASARRKTVLIAGAGQDVLDRLHRDARDTSTK